MSIKNMPKSKIERAIADAIEEIKEIDEELMLETVGVAQALDQLRKALDRVDTCLDEREFEKASRLGYGDVSSEFIFLQRTLGGLQMAERKKQSLISEIAVKSGVGIYEKVEPLVSQRMTSSTPRHETDKIDKKA